MNEKKKQNNIAMSDTSGIWQKEIDKLGSELRKRSIVDLPEWITEEMLWGVHKGRGTTGVLKIAIEALKQAL